MEDIILRVMLTSILTFVCSILVVRCLDGVSVSYALKSSVVIIMFLSVFAFVASCFTFIWS